MQLLTLIGQLKALNKNPEVNKNEIEKLVGAASRSFSVVDGLDFPGEPVCTRARHSPYVRKTACVRS